MLFRDDDLFYRTDLELFKAVDALFQVYGVSHTISVIAKWIDTNPALTKYILEHPHIKVELHAWEHIDLTQNHELAREHFALAIAKIEATFGAKPTVWYPPWHKTDDYLNKLAGELGLKVCDQRCSLESYIKGAKAEVVSFHYWSEEEVSYLETALKLYTR